MVPRLGECSLRGDGSSGEGGSQPAVTPRGGTRSKHPASLLLPVRHTQLEAPGQGRLCLQFIQVSRSLHGAM